MYVRREILFLSQEREYVNKVNKDYTALSKMKTVLNYLQSGILL